MTIKRFEDIKSWQSAQDLAVSLYCDFKECSDWKFKDQILRAVVSISNNIAEGFDRCSDPEFRRFLYYSLGSCSEVKSMLYLSIRLKFINQQQFDSYIKQVSEISRLIIGLIKTLKIE
jgi:four helix bundle protein